MTIPSDTPEESSRPEEGEGATPASLIELILSILRSAGTLIAAKLQLAEREMSQDVGTLARVAGYVVAVAVLLILALGLAGAGLALLLAPWIGSIGTALLVVAGAYALGGLLLLLAAKSRIKKMGGFLSESRADLKRDAEWLKNLS